MTRRPLMTSIFFIAGLRLVISSTPQSAIAGAVGLTQDPSARPETSNSPILTSATRRLATTAAAKPASTPKPTPKPVATVHSGTYTGRNVNYTYGNMQVTVTISGGKVTKASVKQTGPGPIGNSGPACTASVFNSAAINLAAGKSTGSAFQKLKPRACSGATFSWGGYATSLQAAIDKATY